MRKTIVIIVLVFILFLIEYAMFNLLGRWFKPNFSIILIIFINLCWGIRYSLVAAIFSGIIVDSFSVNLFGFNIFSFIICAYLITFIKKNMFHFGSQASRIQLVIVMTIVNAVIHYFLNVMFSSASLSQLINLVIFPELVTTTIAAPYVFHKLKNVIERYSLAI